MNDQEWDQFQIRLKAEGKTLKQAWDALWESYSGSREEDALSERILNAISAAKPVATPEYTAHWQVWNDPNGILGIDTASGPDKTVNAAGAEVKLVNHEQIIAGLGKAKKIDYEQVVKEMDEEQKRLAEQFHVGFNKREVFKLPAVAPEPILVTNDFSHVRPFKPTEEGQPYPMTEGSEGPIPQVTTPMEFIPVGYLPFRDAVAEEQAQRARTPKDYEYPPANADEAERSLNRHTPVSVSLPCDTPRSELAAAQADAVKNKAEIHRHWTPALGETKLLYVLNCYGKKLDPEGTTVIEFLGFTKAYSTKDVDKATADAERFKKYPQYHRVELEYYTQFDKVFFEKPRERTIHGTLVYDPREADDYVVFHFEFKVPEGATDTLIDDLLAEKAGELLFSKFELTHTEKSS